MAANTGLDTKLADRHVNDPLEDFGSDFVGSWSVFELWIYQDGAEDKAQGRW